MKRALLALILALPLAVSAQFRIVGTGLFTTINDSTYRAKIDFRPDLTGNSYNPTQLNDSMLVLSQKGQLYRLDSFYNASFSSAFIIVVEKNGNWGSPVGQVMVFQNNSSLAAPQAVYGANGATAGMQAGVDTWNALLLKVVSDSAVYWNQAYSNSIDSAAFSGTSTKTLELYRASGDTLKASFVITGGADSLYVAEDADTTLLTNGDTLNLTAYQKRMPFDSVTFNVNETDASLRELKYSEEKGYLQYGGQDSVQIPILPGIWYVRNDTSVTIPKGTVLRATGTLGASGRIKVKHMIANGSIDAMYILGIAMHDIAVGADGYAMSQGKIRQVNTQAYSEGAVLYADVDTLGGLTQTEPGNGFLKLPIAFVVHSASNGTIAVRVTSGAYMRDLHDVEVTSPAANASLYYNTAQGIWRDTTGAVLTSDTSAMLNPYLKESELSFSSTTGVSSFSTVVVNSFNALPWDGARVVGITTITGSTGEVTLDLNGNQVVLDISANLSLSGTTDTIELQSSTGTSVHFLAGQNVNLTHSNDTMTISVPISVSTNLSFSGASDTIGLQSGTGQKVFFREGDNINITQAQDTMALDVPLALSISTSLAAGPSTVIVDALNKLPWDGTYVVGITAASTAGVTITLNEQSVSFNPLQFIDTSAMLSSYVNFADTAAMLSPYLKKADTLSLSNRINAKLNISDTTAMLSPYLKKADTTSLSNRINTKLNISDTTVFARNVQISGTTNYLAKFTAGNRVGNSVLFEDTNGDIGAGTTDPTSFGNYRYIENTGRSLANGGVFQTTNSDKTLIGQFYTADGQARLATNTNHRLALWTNNTQRMLIDTVGNVGIGVSSPVSRLHIDGLNDRSFLLHSDGSTYWYGMGVRSSEGLSLFSTDNFGILFGKYNSSGTWTENMRITSAGNVGIATASPSRPLHINATSAIRIPVGNFAERGTSGAGDIRVRNDTANLEFHNGTTWQTVINNSDTSVFARDFQISGTANYLPKFTGSNAVGNSNVYQDATGNIGVGATPSGTAQILDLYRGGVSLYPLLRGNSTAQDYAWTFSDGTNTAYAGMMGGTVTGSIGTGGYSIYLPSGSGSPITFSTNATERMRITSAGDISMLNGNVGINTTSPSRRLHVEGEARISDLTTDPATRIVGADADGDLDAITIGNGVTFASDTLKADTSVLATKAYVTNNTIQTVYIPINLYAPGDTVANTTDSKAFFMVHSGLNGYCIDSYTVKAINGSGTADIQIDKNGTGGNLQAISGTTVATKDTNIALATGDYIRGQVFNLSGTLVGLGLTLEIKKTCN